MKVYTKKGDLGETDLGPGKRASKGGSETGALGAIDELSACLGMATVRKNKQEIEKTLLMVQRDLHRIGAEISGQGRRDLEIKGEDVEKLEKEIDALEEKLPPLKKFVLPGETERGALLHYCRAVCRRAEHAIIKAEQNVKISQSIKAYMNRLSDLLFVMARYENAGAGAKEINPEH